MDELKEVESISSTSQAFAALRRDGTVVTWGSERGGDSNEVQTHLHGVMQIAATRYGFAALRADGRLVTWGHFIRGRMMQDVTDVLDVSGSFDRFAAMQRDGTVMTWGGGGLRGGQEPQTVQII